MSVEPRNDGGAGRVGPGPLPAPTSLHCFGCQHLKTEKWREYMYEDDEWDSGTSARCGAIPNEYGGESITAYWSLTTPVPSWCPFTLKATTPQGDAT